MYDALSPSSGEIAKQEANLDEVLNRVFAQNAAENGYSEELESRAQEFGLAKKSGTKATVPNGITITGTDGTYVNVAVQTAAGLQYTIDSVIVSGGIGTATATAADIGSAYNVPIGTINEFPVQISGLTGVTNTAAATGGTDDETDEGLLSRLLVKVQTPSTSGNANDYKLWALSVPGIGGAKVFPLWNGAGTVKVCLIDSNKQPASADLVTAVQAFTESQRPIGTTVTYEAATGLNINVSATLTVAAGYTVAGVTPAVESAITAYLKSIAFTNITSQNYVSYAKISDAILNVPGVLDLSSLTINSGTGNIEVPSEDVAILGTVTLS